MRFELLKNDPATVAPKLLGCILERTIDGQIIRARIVETEAYNQSDPASHSYNGRTPRTDIMFGPAGYLYVYFTYGMHYCCNIVTGPVGTGSAVLIRAVEPLAGEEYMMKQRRAEGTSLTNGPAKLCQAMNIDKTMNGHDLRDDPLRLIMQPPLKPDEITSTTRVGISKAQNVPWRFYISNNPYVSRKSSVT